MLFKLGYRALQSIPDHRTKKGQRYPLAAMLAIAIAAMLSGANDLTKALGVLVATDDGLGHVAIDGKRLRGSQHGTSPGVHMLHAFSTRLQAAVGTRTVPPDSGEAVEALELIKNLPLEGAVVTGDAAFAYRSIVDAIRERGGDYFLFVKGNQKELRSELARAFGDIPPCSHHRSGSRNARQAA